MPTDEPGTDLFHAQSCARYLGPIPAMSCSEAQVVPITVDGVEVFDEPATVPLRAPVAASPATASVASRARTMTAAHDPK